MNYDHLLLQARQMEHNSKKLARLYLFANLSGLYNPVLKEIFDQLASMAGMDGLAFHVQVQHQFELWIEKCAAMEDKIAASSWMKRWLEDHQKLFSSKTITRAKACSLMAFFLSMVLQKVSFATGKNCLKTQYLNQLLELITEPDFQSRLFPILERPILQAAKGKEGWNPALGRFIETTQVNIQLLASCLLFHMQNLPGPEYVAKEYLLASRGWNKEQQDAFLDSSRLSLMQTQKEASEKESLKEETEGNAAEEMPAEAQAKPEGQVKAAI